MTINELNNLVGIVGEYLHKINNISKSFMKSNDYQSFMGLNADYLVISKCFTVLGNLYVCTHSDSLELSVEVQELISKTFEIASKRCLVGSNDNDDVIEDIKNDTEFTVSELSVIYDALNVYKTRLVECFAGSVIELANKVLCIQKRKFIDRMRL